MLMFMIIEKLYYEIFFQDYFQNVNKCGEKM